MGSERTKVEYILKKNEYIHKFKITNENNANKPPESKQSISIKEWNLDWQYIYFYNVNAKIW